MESYQRSKLWHLPAAATKTVRHASTASLQSSQSSYLREQQALSSKYFTPSTLLCLHGQETSLSYHCHCHYSPGQLLEAPCGPLTSVPASLRSVLATPRKIFPSILLQDFSNTKGKNHMRTTARVGLLEM